MGYLAELNQTIKEIPGMTGINNAMNAKSIAKGALDGTFQFSMLASDAASVGSIATLCRTAERTYASFVQIVLSLNSTIDISVDASPSEYLKRLHRNIMAVEAANSLFVDDCEAGSYMEKVLDGTYNMFVNESANIAVLFNASDKTTMKLVKSHERQLEESLGFINKNKIPNVSNSGYYTEALNEDQIRNIAMDAMINNAGKKEPSTYQNYDTPRMLGEKEAKKMNDMQPYTMAVRLMAVNNKKEFVQFMDFAVGIKVVVHPIPSEEMCTNIGNVLENRGALFNFIRWTSGEKELFKDLILNLNNIKLDVSNRSKGASGWWSYLKRCKTAAPAMMSLFSKYKLVPNATMVLTRYEVDNIQRRFGFNMLDPKTAIKLMNSLFLMTLMVVDDSSDIVYVMYDGQQMYQTYSLEVLDKETASNNGKISKEIMRMIGNN